MQFGAIDKKHALSLASEHLMRCTVALSNLGFSEWGFSEWVKSRVSSLLGKGLMGGSR